MRSPITAAELRDELPGAAAAWLAEARDEPLADLFPAVGRLVGRAALGNGWTVDEAVRVLLLIGTDPAELTKLYRYGEAAEKRAILRALGLPEVAGAVGSEALEIVADAIRTNDQRLLAAALGPYATEWLPQAAFRQAVLKCVFAGVPLATVDGLPGRADDELRRMMSDFAAERTAAGREIPADLQPYLTALRGV